MNPRTALTAALVTVISVLTACGAPDEVDQEHADNLAAEFEAGANNATDETQADVLREQANSLREVGQGNEAGGEGKVATNAE